jgi:hypothetical protein
MISMTHDWACLTEVYLHESVSCATLTVPSKMISVIPGVTKIALSQKLRPGQALLNRYDNSSEPLMWGNCRWQTAITGVSNNICNFIRTVTTVSSDVCHRHRHRDNFCPPTEPMLDFRRKTLTSSFAAESNATVAKYLLTLLT